MIALRRGHELTTHLTAETVLDGADDLVMMGDTLQQKEFAALFGSA